tara:strand:- start:77121 stop:80252 length:3132 start_codon:yes stop_codon:yes gene_type:complete
MIGGICLPLVGYSRHTHRQAETPQAEAPPEQIPTDTVGPFVTAIWGQSEHQHILLEFDDVLPKETLVAQDRVTFWWHDRVTSGVGGVQSVTLNDTTRATSEVTGAMIAMGNTFMRQMPARDIKIIMHTMSGTSPEEIMDDSFVPSGTNRGYLNDWALNAEATADGKVVDFPWHSWFAAPGSWGDNYGQNMLAFIKGRDNVTGAALTYSPASPLNINGINISRTLRDLYPHEPVWIATSGAHVFIPTEDLSNAISVDGGGMQISLMNKQKATESWRSVIRNSALAAHFSTEVFAPNGYANGEDLEGVWNDQPHPTGRSDAGINRMARQMAHAILRGAGVTSFIVPTITQAAWQPDGSFMELWSDTGPLTSNRIEATFDYVSTLDIAGVETLHDAILSGAFKTGVRVSVLKSHTDWATESGLSPSTFSQDVEVNGVAFNNINIAIQNGASVTFRDCRFYVESGFFAVDIYNDGASARFLNCEFVGPADGRGPGTLVRRRAGGVGGKMTMIASRFEGYASDALKPTAGDIVALNYFDAPTPVPTNPTLWQAGAYAVDALVTPSDPRAAFIFKNTVANNTAQPNFGSTNYDVIENGWLNLNPHSDNVTLVSAASSVIFGNVMNLDYTRRQFGGTTLVTLGANAGIWGGSNEDNAGAMIVANYVMREAGETGGNPVGGHTGARYLNNRIESRGQFGSYWFRSPNSGTTIYEGNVDPSSANMAIPVPTNGTSGAVDVTPLEQFSVLAKVPLAEAQRSGQPAQQIHWTDVLGVEIDGLPANRAEVQRNGRVRVYPNTGVFTNTSLVQFGRGGASGWIAHDADAYAGCWNDYPIVDVGLPDIAGVPLGVLPDAAILQSTIVGAPSFQTSDAGPYFRDPVAMGVGRAAVTMLVTLSMDADQADNTSYLIGASAGTFALQAIRSNQSIHMSVRGDGQSSTNVDSATGTFTLGSQMTVVGCVDLIAGTAKAWVDGTQVMDATVPVGTQFQAARNVLMLDSGNGNSQFKGAVERLALWFATTEDGSEPVAAPYKEITGGAATVNTDPWKLATDAT